jgi:leucyl aminopeptidase
MAAGRMLLAGAGERAKFTPDVLRRLGGAVLRFLKPKGIRQIGVILPAGLAAPELVEALAEGAILGDFEPDRYKTDPTKDEKTVDSLTVAVPEVTPALAEALRRGGIVAGAQNHARSLANEPANLLTPLGMADQARSLAAQYGLDCEILDEPRMRQLGMGALLGVAQGSAEPPVLIVLRYVPEGYAAGGDNLALVGKGVTFDTGGISIKPSDGMEKMKYDMSGAAAVLGAMRAIAELKPAVAVTGYAPCVENMPSHKAQRPGDIVKTYCGKTVEVLNTDAEGRLILADALTYAARQGATHMVDAATLTGAIAVALAHVHSGLFSNNDALRDRLRAAGLQAGESLWPMPLGEEYKEMLKSAAADMGNIGSRYGGACTAARFLEEFVEGKPWAHLDIAGTAWLDEGKPHLAKGPTGVAVRTFVRLATSWQPAS